MRPPKTNPRSTEKRSKKKQPQKQKQFQHDAELEKHKKLRYYIEKLLQMKHEEVENLSSASTNDSRKQVRFHESSWLQDGDTTLYCQPPSAGPVVQSQAFQDLRKRQGE